MLRVLPSSSQATGAGFGQASTRELGGGCSRDGQLLADRRRNDCNGADAGQRRGLEIVASAAPGSLQAAANKTQPTQRQPLLARLSALLTQLLANKKECKLDSLEAMINDNALKLLQHKELAFKQNSYPQLDKLCKSTKFDRKELKWLYLGWKVACTEGCGLSGDNYGSESFGIMNEQQFQHIYAQFFPYGGDCSFYARYVFQAMFGELIVKNGGFITFGDYAHALSNLLRGSIEEKVDFIFKLYDLNCDNVITVDELSKIFQSVYKLLGDNVDVKHDQSIYDAQAEQLFKKIDSANTGVITKSQFRNYCLSDPSIVQTIKTLEMAICRG